MSNNLGIEPYYVKVIIARAKVATAVLSNRKVAPLRIEQGFQMISVTTDIAALTTATRADIDAVRAAPTKGAGHA